MLLQVEKLTKRFEGLVAVNEVDFTVNEGEILAIIGPNGSGKSTLFNLISGILHPSSGRVRFQGEDITGLKSHRIASKGITRTFQTTSLFDQLRVVDNLAIGHRVRTKTNLIDALIHTPRYKRERDQTMAKVIEILSFIGLAGQAFDFVSTLSQEQRKRLAIGVALTSNPKLVLLDEPTGGINMNETSGVMEIIRKLKQTGVTVCIIEHKMRMIMDLADRIIALNYGCKIAEGTPQEISKNEAVIEAYLGGEFVA